jgi:thymidylate synthase
MNNYLELLQDVMDNGEDKMDRTGVGTRSVFGRQLRFDLRKGFPAMTTKKLAFNAVKSELLWFISGSGDEKDLREILHGDRDSKKETIWTANAEAPYWKKQWSEFDGDLGRVYGVQWRKWRTPHIEFGAHQNVAAYTTFEIDQIKALVAGLKNDPNSRRHILSAWNAGEILMNKLALPPCHMMAQFHVNSRNELSCLETMRSCDVFLGLPFNIASYALLTHMLAQVCGMQVGELVMSIGDTHVYQNHFDQVREQLSRSPLVLPSLWLNPEIDDIEKFTMDDIQYQSHPAIKAPMAV